MIEAAIVIRYSRSGGLPLNPAAVSVWPVVLFKGHLRPYSTAIPVRYTLGVVPPLFHDLVQVRDFNWGRDGSINLRPYFVIPGSVPSSVGAASCALLKRFTRMVF